MFSSMPINCSKEEASAEENSSSEFEDLFNRYTRAATQQIHSGEERLFLASLSDGYRQTAAVSLRSSPEEALRRRNIMSEYRISRSTDSASNVTSAFNEDLKCAQNMSQYLIHTLATSNRFELTERLINYYKTERDNTNLKTVLAHLPAFASSREDARAPPAPGQLAEERRNAEEIDDNLRFYVNPPGGTKKQSKCCKHCGFVASTKLEYWEHMRCHISGFNCSECSFVTKYKHHMNHHWLSVHDGSKPFKCKKCPYTCVSKSMLTSHLKKHSNVYPYRCANCPYKTKFCNALKKHLRKKMHQPAMVLNADGTPNPLSVIDVYGTKRGPKQKPIPVVRDDGEPDRGASDATGNERLGPATNFPILPLQSPVARYPAVAANDANSAHKKASRSPANENQSVVTCDDLISAFNLSSHLLLREDETRREGTTRITTDRPRSDGVTRSKTTNTGDDETSDVQNAICFDEADVGGEPRVSDNNAKTTSGFSLLVTLEAAKPAADPCKDHSADIPLDLRVTKLAETSQPPVAKSPKVSGTSKRKGRARKLESRSVEEDETSEQSDIEVIPADSQLGHRRRKIEVAEDAVADLIDKFICYYCEITFGNVVMYTMHMGYHGFDDPYTCNICGLRYTDKVSFFLHIGRSKHNE